MKTWEFIKQNIVIIICLLLLLELGFLFWTQTVSLSEFGLNFFTEIIGVAITVFIVDELIKAREERRNLGPKTLAYRSIVRFVSSYIWFWRELYRSSVPKNEPKSIDGFFTRENFYLIWFYLDLEAKPNKNLNVVPDSSRVKEFLFSGNYWEYIPNRMKKYDIAIKEIVNTYSNYLEPEILTILIEIGESDIFKKLIDLDMGRASFEDGNRNREHLDTRPLLKNWSGALLTKTDSEHVLTLHKWCIENYKKFKGKSKDIEFINLPYNKPLEYKEGTIKPDMISDFTGHDKPPVCIIFGEG